MTSKFVKECLSAHNTYRKAHDAKPLKLKEELNKHAQQWANKLAASGTLKHSNNRSFGENVAMTSKGDPSGQEITAMWYDEIQKYNFRTPGFKSGTGHFTQVVWKGSTDLGVGIAKGKYGTFVVANYEPAGNITNPGYFEKNVATPNKKVKVEHKARSRKDSSSSSSSSSSSDDETPPSKPASLRGGKKTETKVETKVKEFTDSQGRKVKETTKITTTITTEGGSKSTSTKTDVHTEYLGGAGSSGKLADDPTNATKIGSMSIASPKSSMTEMDRRTFRIECLKRHNDLRKKHDTPPLVVTEKLEKAAQKWADHLAQISRLQHSSGNDYGENVAYKFSSDKRKVTGGEMCDMWYNEIKDYKFSKPGFSSNTGHFTQVVWVDSKEVGVGVADDGKGNTFAVANYSPPGNFRNKFEANVKAPRR